MTNSLTPSNVIQTRILIAVTVTEEDNEDEGYVLNVDIDARRLHRSRRARPRTSMLFPRNITIAQLQDRYQHTEELLNILLQLVDLPPTIASRVPSAESDGDDTEVENLIL